ncbi:MAG: quinone oxidoreductase [Novosphingobium sp.]|nr:quinone oxidoreductase [Novosphingobium sp.]
MTRAIMIREYGGPDVLRMEDVAVSAPAAGEVRLRQTAIGVNYHDVYVRSGLYRTLALPGVPGLEGVGVVEAVGEGVTAFARGDRVGYIQAGYGAYAEERVVAADSCVRLPDGVDDALAAALLLKGVTASALVHQVHPLHAGDVVLVHAAAGGVGHLLAQWAKLLGARVIGTAGSPEKVQAALGYGCDDVIPYRETDFAERVLELTGGKGANVVYDAVGRDTFDGSLKALAIRGHLVNYGQASGPIPPFDISRLAPKSASITRPGYSHYMPTPEAFRAVATGFFAELAAGRLRAEPATALPLDRAAQAHEALESRAAGPFVLVP